MGPELRIRSAKELHEVLLNSDIKTQVGVLQAIADRPQEVLVYGADPESGADLIDVLVRLVRESQGVLRRGAIGAAARFDDARVGRLFLELMKEETNPGMLKDYAGWLSGWDSAEVRNELLQLLVGDDPDKVKAVAFAVKPEGLKTELQRFRFSLFREGVAMDGLADSELWLEHQSGPFSRSTRRLLEEGGESSFHGVFLRRRSLEPEMKEWLLQWAVRLERPEVEELAYEVLETAPLIALKAAGDRFSAEVLGYLLRHPSVKVQVEAVNCGAPAEDWHSRCCEGDESLRVAWIRRLPPESKTLLDSLSQDPNWKIRAAARERAENLD